MATNGDATIFLYDHGGWTWTPRSGLPKSLHNKLKGRNRHTMPSPIYVSLGSEDRYYIEFADGKSQWIGPDDLSDALNEEATRSVASVAFGEDMNSYFIVFKDGGWSYYNVPSDLDDLVTKTRRAM